MNCTLKNMTGKKTIGAIALLLVCSFLAGGQVMDGADQTAPSADAIKQARIEYAQALLEHAKANLAAIQSVNQRGAGEVVTAVLRPFQTEVALAESRLKTLQSNDSSMAEDYVACLKANLETAEGSLKKAIEISARVPNAISAVEIAQRKSDVALAKARLKVAELAMKASPIERLEAQVIGLQDDVRELKSQVELLQSRN